jgi:large subunit ribosomal protein L6
MSRIGKKPVKVLEGVKLTSNENIIEVTGPKGKLSVEVDPQIKYEINNDEVQFTRPSETKKMKALHGLYAVLLKNSITGVKDGYKKNLELVGIGYRAEKKGNMIALNLGFSHPIYFLPPEGITIDVVTDNKLTISGIDKQLVGQVAAKIRSFRKPEPYKGKGIKYEGEFIRRKAGKAAAK